MRSRGSLVVLIVVVAGILLVGCGSGSPSQSNSSTVAGTPAAQSSASAAAKARLGRSAGAQLPKIGKPAHLSSGIVAKVDGTSITTVAYNHQLQVSAPVTIKSLIANSSDYSGCIAAVKSREAKTEKLIRANQERIAKQSKGRAKTPGLLAGSRKARTDAQLKQQCELQYKAFKQQAISSLIRRLQNEAEAKELGVTVSESEVATQVKTREARQKELAKSSRYAELGLAEARDTADLTEEVKSQLLETRIFTKVREKFAKSRPVSQSELEKYFNEHKQIYGQTEQRSIVFVSTKTQSIAEAIAKEHSSGGLMAAAAKHATKATPTTVACQHSSAAKGSQVSTIIEAICSAKTGALSGPVKMTSTYYVFEVKSITPASQPSFASAKARIKELLTSQSSQEPILKYNNEIRAKLKAGTECSVGYIVELCKEYTAPTG
jgi:peptidyl-prolyl cis-trans isomerase C